MTKKIITKKINSKLIQDLSNQESEKIWGGQRGNSDQCPPRNPHCSSR
ncbi:MAG: hypothetical protein AB4372_09795 [Xenococcus sp. (in: cyanobacteria)]